MIDKKEDLPKELPGVAVEGLQVDDVLHNTIDINIKGSHSKGIQSIDVFANDQLLASTQEADLAFNWNTLDFEDGTYDVKVVVKDKEGNKSEMSRKVVLNNALISIDKSILIDDQKAWYYITDSAGNILNNVAFDRSEIYGEGRKSINPKEPFFGRSINLIRVSKRSSLPTIIEYFVDLERGKDLNFKNHNESHKYPSNNLQYIPLTVKNVIDYDFATFSTDRSGFSFPIPKNHPLELPYANDKSKVFIQIEQENQARYGIFDVSEAKAALEFDADLCQLPSLKKTITFPAAVEEGYVYLYGKPYEGYAENYLVADKRFLGSSVNVFYPEMLVNSLLGHVSYRYRGIHFSHRYFDTLPENMLFSDMEATVKNTNVSSFEADLKGKFDYYSVSYENKEYTGSNNDTYIEILVYAPKDQNKFSFPDISEGIDLPGFKLSDFRATEFKMYDYDGKSEASNHFNLSGNLIRPIEASYMITNSMSLKSI